MKTNRNTWTRVTELQWVRKRGQALLHFVYKDGERDAKKGQVLNLVPKEIIDRVQN